MYAKLDSSLQEHTFYDLQGTINITRKVLNQGFLLVKLKSLLRKYFGRHYDLVNLNRYGIYVSQMTTNIFHLQQELPVLSSFMTYHRVSNQSNTTIAHEFTPGVQWGSCCSIFSFLCNVLQIVVCTVVLFLFAIVLSIRRCTDSDYRYPFCIFKLFLQECPCVRGMYIYTLSYGNYHHIPYTILAILFRAFRLHAPKDIQTSSHRGYLPLNSRCFATAIVYWIFQVTIQQILAILIYFQKTLNYSAFQYFNYGRIR